MVANFLVRMRTHRLHYAAVTAFAISCAFLVPLLYPLILRLVLYFFPLLSITAVCFTAFYLFMMSETGPTEVLIVHGEKSEHGVVQVFDGEVNKSTYGGHVEACSFLLRPKSGQSNNRSEEDEERAVFAGKLRVGVGNLGFFGDEVSSCVVDRLAEGAWNCYFGKSSEWHYTGDH